MKLKLTRGRLWRTATRLGVGAVFLTVGVGICTAQESFTGRFTYAQQPDGTWNRVELHAPNPGVHYVDGLTAAQSLGGHLFTPRSRMENAAAAGLLNGTWQSGWIGLDDRDDVGEGNWSLIDDGAGREQVWTGLGSGAGGTPMVGRYHNWNGAAEPNDVNGEDAAELLRNGYWNDLPDANAQVTRALVVEFDTGLASQPDPAPGLPQGTPGMWNIRRINGSSDMQNARGVEADLYSSTGTTADYQSPVINFLDQNSGDARMPGGVPFPGDDPNNADENFFALYARAQIRIDQEDDYTFGFSGDDGSELRIHGQNFTSSTVIGADGSVYALESNLPAVTHDGDRLAAPQPGGDAAALGVVHLTPGVYDLTYTWYEDGGGAHAEVYAARGAHSVFDGNAFRPIGYQHVPGAVTVDVGVTAEGWQVATTLAGGEQLGNLATAFAEYTTEFPDTVGHDQINFSDPQTAAAAGRFGGDVPFDNNTAADDEDFAVYATAVLDVPVDGVYRLGFQGDDGGELGFFDSSIAFTSIIENATNAATIGGGLFGGPEGRNALITDIPTGDSSTVGEVSLAAGQYPIYGVFWERAGGAYWEVFGAGPGGPLKLLTANGSVIVPDFDGLALVPEPSSALLLGLSLLGLAGWRRRR